MLLHCKNINWLHYFKYYLLSKMLICMIKWFAGLFLGVLTHGLWCNVIYWAKLLYMFSIYYHYLKWEYSTINQHGTGRWKCQFFFENYFSILNNIVNSIQSTDCWRANDKFSWSNFYFITVKEFLYYKKY